MKILAIDAASSTGYAVFNGRGLQTYGTLTLTKNVAKHGEYPFNCFLAALGVAAHVNGLIAEFEPDLVYVEQTNQHRSLLAGKFLEFMHCFIIASVPAEKLRYLTSSQWRNAIGISKNKLKKDLKSQAVDFANKKFKLSLKATDHNTAEAICLGHVALLRLAEGVK